MILLPKLRFVNSFILQMTIEVILMAPKNVLVFCILFFCFDTTCAVYAECGFIR